MSLKDAIEAQIAASNPGPRCTIAEILAKLAPEDQAYLRGVIALDSTKAPATSIARALTSEGHRIDGNTIARHRRGDCSCPR